MSPKRFFTLIRLAASTLCVPAAVLLLWVAPPAAATATYQYTGVLFGQAIPPFTTSNSIDGAITLTNPIPGGSTALDVSAEINTYDFTDGVHTYTPSTSSVATATFTTNSGGSVTGWDLVILGTGSISQFVICTFRNGAVCQASQGVTVDAVTKPASSGAFVYADNQTPGAWVQVIPEPSTLSLIATGFSVLAAVARRKTA